MQAKLSACGEKRKDEESGPGKEMKGEVGREEKGRGKEWNGKEMENNGIKERQEKGKNKAQ